MRWRFYRATPLIERRSKDIDKWGVIPRVPRQNLLFLNEDTGLINETNDLSIAKQKRTRTLNKIEKIYSSLFESKKISLILISVPVKAYDAPSKFYKEFFKKLRNENGIIYGYYWQRDLGEKEFEPHFHFIVFTSRMNGDTFKKILSRRRKKKSKDFAAEFCDSLSKFKNYLKDKDFYSPDKCKSWGCSRNFLTP